MLRERGCPVGVFGPDVPLFAPVKRFVIVTCHFNPCGFRRPRENYDRFAEGMAAAGAELFTVELAFDDYPFNVPGAQLQIRGRRDRHMLWQKERLLNLAISALPADVDAVGWFDADVLFDSAEWLPQAIERLGAYQVMQPWREARVLGRDGGEVLRKTSTAWMYHHKRDEHLRFHRSHPGFAWAARVEWIRKHGLYDANVTGGSDTCMIGGFSPDSEEWIRQQLNPEWYSHCRCWCEAVQKDVRGLLGYIDQHITHLYHGERRDRRYVERWRCLRKHGFDPTTHITIDGTGLLTWTDEAPQSLRQQVAEYFALRREDG